MSFNDRLGIRLGGTADSVILDPGPEHEVAPGTVHFAVLTTLGEVAAARAAAGAVVPAQVSLQLLRRAVPGSSLEARGEVVKAGRSLVFAEGIVRQGGEVVAKVAVVFARLGS